MYYSVSLFYKSERSDSVAPLWEERVILVSAADESEAEKKAQRRAKEYESTFVASDSVKIEWKFYQVERVHAIDDVIEDGVELFSRFLRASEAASILTPFED